MILFTDSSLRSVIGVLRSIIREFVESVVRLGTDVFVSAAPTRYAGTVPELSRLSIVLLLALLTVVKDATKER